MSKESRASRKGVVDATQTALKKPEEKLKDIPALYWMVKIHREIEETEDPERKKDLQKLYDDFNLDCQLRGLYE